MSDGPKKLLADRIGAIIERVQILALDRDDCRRDGEESRSRADAQERESSRLRTVIGDAVRELREE